MKEHYPFRKKPLPYDYTSLIPHCDPNTLYLHHVQIYGRYVDMLNYYLAPYAQYHSWSLEQLIEGDLNIPTVTKNNIKNNAGAVYSHELYFSDLCSNQPPLSGNLSSKIQFVFGSILNFKNLFKQAAYSIPGAGWVWLVSEGLDDLHIVTTQNNETPQLSAFGNVLTLDTWEHAYYLPYPAKFGDYVDNWFQTLNWEKIEKRYTDMITSSQSKK